MKSQLLYYLGIYKLSFGVGYLAGNIIKLERVEVKYFNYSISYYVNCNGTK